VLEITTYVPSSSAQLKESLNCPDAASEDQELWFLPQRPPQEALQQEHVQGRLSL